MHRAASNASEWECINHQVVDIIKSIKPSSKTALNSSFYTRFLFHGTVFIKKKRKVEVYSTALCFKHETAGHVRRICPSPSSTRPWQLRSESVYMPFPQVEEVNRAKSIPVSLRESVLPIHRPPAGVAKTETKIRQDVDPCP